MKNVLFAFVLLALLSCKKEADPAIDYSLLTQFKWQYIKTKEETLHAVKMTYSDTSSYVFNDDTFVSKFQFTTIQSIWGGGEGHKFHLVRQNFTNKGTWYLNAEKGTLHLTQTTCDRRTFDSPCVETLHHSTLKILSLNKNILKLQGLDDIPFIVTYSPIKK